jgi:hypothetical protein
MLRYEELSEPERAVWDAVEAGVLVELPLAPQHPTTDETWGKDRQVRAHGRYSPGETASQFPREGPDPPRASRPVRQLTLLGGLVNGGGPAEAGRWPHPGAFWGVAANYAGGTWVSEN